MDNFKNSLRADLIRLIDRSREKGITFKELLTHFEMEFILQVLRDNDFNISKSSEELNINRNTLSKKIEKYKKYKFFKDSFKKFKSGSERDNR